MPVTYKKIGVLAGGLSAEREVSLKTGGAIYNALKGLGYNVCLIDAGKDLAETIKKENVEAAFIALHGGHGEDGSIQGLLEVAGVPYTGSGVLASALAMDKEFSKRMFREQGLPVPEGVTLGKNEFLKAGGILAMELDFAPLPWVVKPVTEGSSIGVSMVGRREELAPALEKAFLLSGRVIVERRVLGKEVQVGILGGRVLGSVEIRPSLDFYSYEAKYTGGKTRYILPPEVDAKHLEEAHRVGLAAHKALGCRGATRVDLILDPGLRPWVLEVNTIPGMTETSLLPKIAKQYGLDFPALVEEILKEALEG